ncbi:hypothetical protein VTN00DRAFT_6653 [Thermoascus crustaceus]|uniref:uncharacterized protein n=1 Tax=Thermoascus crustaceus TaxID=5088 RepID=UPI0037442BDC
MDPPAVPLRTLAPFSGTNSSEQQLQSNSVRSSMTDWPTVEQRSGDTRNASSIHQVPRPGTANNAGSEVHERSSSRARSAPPPQEAQDQPQTVDQSTSRVKRCAWRKIGGALIIVPVLITPVLCIVIILGVFKGHLGDGESKRNSATLKSTLTFTTAAEPARMTSPLTTETTILANETEAMSIPAVATAPLASPLGPLPLLPIFKSVETDTFGTTFITVVVSTIIVTTTAQ